MMQIHSDYLKVAFEPNARTMCVDLLVEEITCKYPDITNCLELNSEYLLVGTGLSGTILLHDVATELTLPYAIVRKENSSHSMVTLEGIYDKDKVNKIIIIDDFIDTGETYAQVIIKLFVAGLLKGDTQITVLTYSSYYTDSTYNVEGLVMDNLEKFSCKYLSEANRTNFIKESREKLLPFCSFKENCIWKGELSNFLKENSQYNTYF